MTGFAAWLLNWAFVALAVLGLMHLYDFLIRRFIPVQREDRTFVLHLLLLVQDQEDQIEGVFRSVSRFMGARGERVQLVIADTGSSDGTPFILNRLQCHDPGLMVMQCQPDGALAALLQSCGGPLALVADLRNKQNSREVLKELERIR